MSNGLRVMVVWVISAGLALAILGGLRIFIDFGESRVLSITVYLVIWLVLRLFVEALKGQLLKSAKSDRK